MTHAHNAICSPVRLTVGCLAVGFLLAACSQSQGTDKGAEVARDETHAQDTARETNDDKEDTAVAQAKSFANPYELADAALAAIKSGDAKALDALIGGASAAGDTLGQLGATDGDRVQGLYFQEGGREIAAVIRKAADGQKAVWLRIKRAEGGFVLQEIVVGGDNPDMEIDVEGF